jgi:DNA-directed RNA polymerase specialized sigma24 family protein
MTDADAPDSPLFEDPTKEKAARALVEARTECRKDVRDFTARRENDFWNEVADVYYAGTLTQQEIADTVLGVHRDTVRVRTKRARDARREDRNGPEAQE